MRVIYDIGASNGDDIPYYLLRADKVVSVEANPVLCEAIRSRFADEILEGHLVVENVVLLDEASVGDVPFYIHKRNHVLSQFPTPTDLTQFERVLLSPMSIVDLVNRHGEPLYVKIDFEHYDVQLLKALFTNGIHPPFISAESHCFDVFATLAALGHYKSFKLVDGASVSQVYRNETFNVGFEKVQYSFPVHSAGPFGDDIHGDWIGIDKFFQKLALEGFGWKDIHASNIREADPAAGESLGSLLQKKILRSAVRVPKKLRRRLRLRSRVKALFET